MKKLESGDLDNLEIDTALLAERLNIFEIKPDWSSFEIDSLYQLKFVDLLDPSQKTNEFRLEIDKNCILTLQGQRFNPNPKRNFKDWIDEMWYKYKIRKNEPDEIFYDYGG